MPDQQKQVMEYYQNNPSAASSLRGSIYEEKILNFIKTKSKVIKKTISLEEAENILKIEHDQNHDHEHQHRLPKKSKDETLAKSAKKIKKSTPKKKKIRKK